MAFMLKPPMPPNRFLPEEGEVVLAEGEVVLLSVVEEEEELEMGFVLFMLMSEETD